jgi:serine/threonine protein kinase
MPDEDRSPAERPASSDGPRPGAASEPRAASTSVAAHPSDDTKTSRHSGESGAPAGSQAAFPATVPPPERSAARHPLPPGTRVGPYEILERIGKGGMGIVYRARHREIPRVAALKMMIDGEAASKSLARFRKDAGSLDQVRHDNIVRLYEYDVDPAHGPYFALELVEGGSLASQLHPKSPWEFRRAARLVETLARATDFAHRHHIVHRDLKPGNVLLAPLPPGTSGEGELDFVPKITDFGLAKTCAVSTSATTVAPEEQNLTYEGAVMGTPSYMAPEQSLGRLDLDHRVDVYALGAILYELLTGRPPFVGGPFDVLAQLQNYTVPPPVRTLRPDVPAALEAICLRCLQREPAARYATAAELADALAAWRAAAPPSTKSQHFATPPRAWAVRVARRVRRRPVRAALVVLVAVLLCGGGYVAYQLTSQAKAEAARLKKEAEERDEQEKQAAGELKQKAEEQVVQAEIVAREKKGVADEAAKRLDRPAAARAYIIAQIAYQQLANDHPDRPAYRIKFAEMLNEEGRMRFYLREWDSAQRAVESALAELNKAPQDEPRDSLRDRLLQEAEAYHLLGQIFSTRDDTPTRDYQKVKANWIVARKYYDDSLNKRTVLDGLFRQDSAIRRDLARSHGYLGDTCLSLFEYSDARVAYRNAQEIREELAKEAPDKLDAQMQLARSYANTGYYYRHLGDPNRALPPFRTARQHLAKYMAKYLENPDPPDFILDYARNCNDEAELLIDREPGEEDRNSGLGLLKEAKDILAPRKEAHPDDPSLVSELGRTYLLLGKYHLGPDPHSARDDLNNADKLLDRGLRQKGPDDLANRALVLALQSQLTEDAGKKEDLVKLADRFLGWAYDKGYNNLGRLKNDPGFQPLRKDKCEMYEKVVQALEKEKESQQ